MSIFVPIVIFLRRKTTQSLNMSAKDIINFKALSEAVTGSKTKIRKNNTSEKYADDVAELVDMIELWVKWKREKHRQ